MFACIHGMAWPEKIMRMSNASAHVIWIPHTLPAVSGPVCQSRILSQTWTLSGSELHQPKMNPQNTKIQGTLDGLRMMCSQVSLLEFAGTRKNKSKKSVPVGGDSTGSGQSNKQITRHKRNSQGSSISQISDGLSCASSHAKAQRD